MCGAGYAVFRITAAEEMGVFLSRCLYVGDSEVDVLTAQNAGIACASVCWGFRSREALLEAGAQLLADSPAQIPKLLETLSRK